MAAAKNVGRKQLGTMVPMTGGTNATEESKREQADLVLSSFYTAIAWAGTAVFHREKKASRQTFNRRQWTLVSLLSVCTALNVLVGRANIAVPTTFDQQIIQAIGPVLVLLIATRIFKRSVSRARKVAVVPIVIGVAMTWYSEMEVSRSAIAVSVVCIVLNAIKVVINSEILTGESKVAPLHLLSRLAPMTLIQVAAFALLRGEVAGMVGQWREILTGWAPHVIALTGFASFVMTVLSMHATTFATPLTVSVMGTLKQILVVAFSVLRMKRAVSRLNVLGLLFVLAGAVRYAVVSRREKKQREQRRGATSAGSGNKAAQRHHSNNGGSVAAVAAAMSSGSSLLPTTVRLPAVDTATGVRAVMVNGKRAAKREECGAGSGGVKVEGGRVTTMAWGSGWWGAENGDVSRRDR
ncbi:unnamed protein product [Pylaiella littoralis]